MSKLPFPVIASIPLCPLKFDFDGKLSELSIPNCEFVTQGGFPIMSRKSFSFNVTTLFNCKSKMF